MAPPNDYRKPRNKELRDLAWNLPLPMRIKDPSGRLLWRNKLAEGCQGDGDWDSFPTTWQNKVAVLEMPAPASRESTADEVARLSAELDRLKKQQRQTARKKRQAEKAAKKVKKTDDSVSGKEKELQKSLDASRKSEKALQKKLEAAQKKLEQGDKARGLLKDLESEKRKLEKELKALESSKNSLESEKSVLKDKRDALAAEKSSLVQEFEAYKAQVEEEDAERKLAEKVAELEKLEETFENEQKAFDEQKVELQRKLEESELEFAKLKETVEKQDSAELDAVTPAPEEVAELAELRRNELRLFEKLDALEDVREEQSKVLKLLKDDLEAANKREKDLQKELDEKSQQSDQGISLAEAEMARLTQRVKELEATEQELRGKIKVQIEQKPQVAEEPSLSVKNQIDFLEKRLTALGKELDQSQALLREERAQNQASKEAEKLAFQDDLTGLPNRHMASRFLNYAHQQAKVSGRALALFLIDIDGFRVLNATYGREWGDAVIKAVGERLNGMRGKSHLVARHSQDRFILLAAEIDKQGLSNFLQEASKSLLGALSYPFDLEGEEVRLTGSVGVAVGPCSGEGSEPLYKDAESALEEAKKAGGARWMVYDDKLQQSLRRANTYGKQMAHAIDKDEFSAVYQPVYHLSKNMVLGLELLLRWHHRDRRILTPGDFLKAAIKTGLIFKITDRLWPQAFRQFAKWRRMRPGLTLSINLCDKELLNPTLLKKTLAWTKEAGLEPSSIVFEVRDGSRLRLSSNWWRILQEYSHAGFGLCLDDFGADESFFGTLAYGGFTQAKMLVKGSSPKLITAPQATKGVLYCAKGIEGKFDKKGLSKAGFHLAQGLAVSQPLEVEGVDVLFT